MEITDADVFAMRDQWVRDNPWYEQALADIAEYKRAVKALNPVVIVTQIWRDGKLVEERRELQ